MKPCRHDAMQLGNCQRCGEHYVTIIQALQEKIKTLTRRLARIKRG